MYYLIHKGHFIKGDSILKGQKERKRKGSQLQVFVICYKWELWATKKRVRLLI
jgi:hypothetical protein